MEDPQSTLTEIITVIVRLVGLVILLVGLYIGIKVVFEAWHLYEQPQRIERFAKAIEHGSQLDSLIASIASNTSSETGDMENVSKPGKQEKPTIRLTYFLAWGIVAILLMVISSLAATAMKTGGQLALYGLQIKQLAKRLNRSSIKQD